MKITLKTSGKFGKCSIIMMLIAAIIFSVVVLLDLNIKVNTVNSGFLENITLAIMTFVAFVFGVISMIIGFIAVIKKNERSIFVYLCVILGLMSIYFGTGQILGAIFN